MMTSAVYVLMEGIFCVAMDAREHFTLMATVESEISEKVRLRTRGPSIFLPRRPRPGFAMPKGAQGMAMLWLLLPS